MTEDGMREDDVRADDVRADEVVAEGGDHVDGVAALAPQMWEEVVLDTVRETHAAIAARTFRLVPGSSAARVVHDGVAGAVYGVLTAATRGTRAVAERVARATAAGRDPDVLERHAAWRRSRAILNGVIGDLLEEQGNPLALPMTIRRRGADVPVEAAALAEAFPDATDRIAVLLHGLVEDDEAWAFKVASRPTTYPSVLRRAGVTPVVLRYNTGRHISDNAASLDELLDGLLAAWPVEVAQVLLVGHSMGGLVIRGAGEVARVRERTWPARVSHVVCLGSPHGGAPLEKVANAGAWMLSAVPEMAPFGSVLRRRSAGIKDLRHGYLLGEDWADGDPDAWRSPVGRDVGLLGEAVHHVVGATLGPTDTHPLSRLGDLLVRWGSATAAGREWAVAATVTHVGSADHFALLNHPTIADLLVDMASARPPGPPT